jgi:hypothetical protein
MASNKRPGRRLGAFAVAATATGFMLLGAAGPGAAAPRGCPTFASQAKAQAHYLQLGGSPGHAVAALDPDRDGVACEELGRSYAGYANLGYNRRKDFFYGSATMPEIVPVNEGEAATHPCMLGNRHFDDGPRRLNVYRVLPGPDKRIFPREGIGAEAREDSGRLVWKAEHETVLPGRYYAEFEERIRLTPYGENECPAFRSPVVALP